MPIRTLLHSRICKAVLTWPDAEGWRDTGLLFCGFALIASPLGIALGFLCFEISSDPLAKLVTFSAIALLLPGFAEELLFRVIPLPHQSEHPSGRAKILWAIVALILFVGSHPLNGLFFRTAMRSVFLAPEFLAMAGLLGITCTLAYFRTGSIWPPLIIHWATVVLWRLVLGGKVL